VPRNLPLAWATTASPPTRTIVLSLSMESVAPGAAVVLSRRMFAMACAFVSRRPSPLKPT
jgi:hypothetical protein